MAITPHDETVYWSIQMDKKKREDLFIKLTELF